MRYSDWRDMNQLTLAKTFVSCFSMMNITHITHTPIYQSTLQLISRYRLMPESPHHVCFPPMYQAAHPRIPLWNSPVTSKQTAHSWPTAYSKWWHFQAQSFSFSLLFSRHARQCRSCTQVPPPAMAPSAGLTPHNPWVVSSAQTFGLESANLTQKDRALVYTLIWVAMLIGKWVCVWCVWCVWCVFDVCFVKECMPVFSDLCISMSCIIFCQCLKVG